jgi:transcriptional regulator with XRE-family HTH domain
MDGESRLAAAQLGKRIRRERTRQGLSLKEIEKRAGISPTHLSEIERGKSSPTVGVLTKIAQALDRPLSQLVVSSPSHDTYFGDSRTRCEWILDRSSVRLKSLLDPAVPFDVFLGLVLLPPGARLDERDCWMGVRELLIHVVEGRIEATVGEDLQLLAVGDSLHCRGELAHGMRNPDASTARAYVITSPRMRF